MGRTPLRAWLQPSAQFLGFLAFIAAVPVSAPYNRVLRPAHYLSQCALYDPQPVPKIGQAVFVLQETAPMLVYNEIAVSRASAPFVPEAYILETGSGEKVLYISRNDTIFLAKANTFIRLGGAGFTLKKTLPRLQSLLKEKHRLVFVPCFSKKWDGEYPKRPSR